MDVFKNGEKYGKIQKKYEKNLNEIIDKMSGYVLSEDIGWNSLRKKIGTNLWIGNLKKI